MSEQTKAIIKQARKLIRAASPGPWDARVWYGSDDGGWAAVGPHHTAIDGDGYDAPGTPPHGRAMADAALIAAAPVLLAALCDAIEAAEAGNISMSAELAHQSRQIELLRWMSTSQVGVITEMAGVEFQASLDAARRRAEEADAARVAAERFRNVENSRANDLGAKVIALRIEVEKEAALRADLTAEIKRLREHVIADEVKRMRAEMEAEVVAIAVGCNDYKGGYHGAEYDAFQAGIATVGNAMRAWAKRGTADTQVRALVRIGEEADK